MKSDKIYDQLASEDSIMKTFKALEKNWIHSFIVNSRDEARDRVLNLIPNHGEVMNMTSVTVDTIGLDMIINESNEFISVRKLLEDKNINEIEKKRLWTAHEWAVWSVHAVTEDWQILIASATWSQLASYAYWAINVIWIIWTQKIVKNLDEAMERVYEYVFPLEDERSMKAYWAHSWVNKILLVNKEVVPWRIHVIFVKEKLWF